MGGEVLGERVRGVVSVGGVGVVGGGDGVDGGGSVVGQFGPTVSFLQQ